MGLEARLLLGHCSPRLSALSGPSRIGPTDHFEGIRASHIKGQTLVEMAGTHHRSHIMENVTLTPKEQSRLQVLNSLAAEHMTLDQAAELMGVTSRHTRRILAAYCERGAAALAHGHRGRRPVNATPEALVVDLAQLARTRYAGVNHTHLAELLAEREGIHIGRTTLRRVLLDAGLSSPRRRRPPKHRVRRQRMPQEGMLIQMDGSYHPWLGDRRVHSAGGRSDQGPGLRRHLQQPGVAHLRATGRSGGEFPGSALDGGPYPYVWLDGLTQKVREGGRIVNVCVVVATGVNAEGQREILGMDVGASEDGAFWLAFLRSLTARGLSGVELVTSDAHQGLKNAIAAVFAGASWQRCRTHFMANLLSRVPKRAQPGVATMVRTIYQQLSPAEVHGQLDRVVEQLREPFAQVAELLADAAPDILAFTAFPVAHWQKLWSNTRRNG